MGHQHQAKGDGSRSDEKIVGAYLLAPRFQIVAYSNVLSALGLAKRQYLMSSEEPFDLLSRTFPIAFRTTQQKFCSHYAGKGDPFRIGLSVPSNDL